MEPMWNRYQFEEVESGVDPSSPPLPLASGPCTSLRGGGVPPPANAAMRVARRRHRDQSVQQQAKAYA